MAQINVRKREASRPRQLEALDKLYEENKEKLTNVPSHPINQVALAKWVNDLTANDTGNSLALFGSQIAMHLRHVSFTEFHDTLLRVANEIKADIIAAQYTKPKAKIQVVALADGEWSKSNTWALLLMWPVLGEWITHIVRTPEEAVELHTMGVEEDKDALTFVIHTDDASYSGTQFFTTSRDVLENMMDDPTIKKNQSFSYYMAFPFISQFVRDIALGDMFLRSQNEGGCLIIPNATQTFDSLKTSMLASLGKSRFEILEYFLESPPYKAIFGYAKPIHCIYFDHKLADGLSTINKILALAPVLTKDNEVTADNLIVGCKIEDYRGKYTGDNPSAKDHARDAIPELDFYDNFVCPKAFYKFIKYTFNDVLVSSMPEIKSYQSLPVVLDLLSHPKSSKTTNQKISKRADTCGHCGVVARFECSRYGYKVCSKMCHSVMLKQMSQYQ